MDKELLVRLKVLSHNYWFDHPLCKENVKIFSGCASYKLFLLNIRLEILKYDVCKFFGLIRLKKMLKRRLT